MVNSSMILMLNQYVSPKKQKYLEILIWFLALNFIERVSKIEFLFFFFLGHSEQIWSWTWMSFCQLQLCIAIKIDDILNEFNTFSFQAVIKQFSASGYERSDVMVIDEVEMQRHQQLEKLYRSTRGTKVWMFLLFILLISFVWFCVWRWIDIWLWFYFVILFSCNIFWINLCCLSKMLDLI